MILCVEPQVEFLPIALLLVGIFLMLVGWFWIVCQAFTENIGWGLGSLFVGLVWLIFTAMHWQRARRPFGYFMLGLLTMIGSVVAGVLLGEPAKRV